MSNTGAITQNRPKRGKLILTMPVGADRVASDLTALFGHEREMCL
jgi:hypothetical protein